jgi:hypothetical protein
MKTHDTVTCASSDYSCAFSTKPETYEQKRSSTKHSISIKFETYGPDSAQALKTPADFDSIHKLLLERRNSSEVKVSHRMVITEVYRLDFTM